MMLLGYIAAFKNVLLPIFFAPKRDETFMAPANRRVRLTPTNQRTKNNDGTLRTFRTAQAPVLKKERGVDVCPKCGHASVTKHCMLVRYGTIAGSNSALRATSPAAKNGGRGGGRGLPTTVHVVSSEFRGTGGGGGGSVHDQITWPGVSPEHAVL